MTAALYTAHQAYEAASMVKQNAEMVEEMYQDGTLEPYVIAALVFLV